jgi:hypothetical protein
MKNILRLTCITLGVAALSSAAALLTPSKITANSTGVTGSYNAGCSCHGPSANQGVTVALSTPDGPLPSAIEPGQTIELVLTTQGLASSQFFGFNLAVTGSNNQPAGTIEAITSGVRRSGAQLTHSSRIPLTGNAGEMRFRWTAPQQTGSYSVRAVVNAVNGNGSDNGDAWNFLTPVTINVEMPTSVRDMISFATKMSLAPMPASERTTVSFVSIVDAPARMEVIDINGRTVLSDNVSVRVGENAFPLSLASIPQGHYTVVLSMNGERMNTPLVVSAR